MPGLTADEAAIRLRFDGPNAMPPPGVRPRRDAPARSSSHFFALMLWVAAALAFVAGMPRSASRSPSSSSQRRVRLRTGVPRRPRRRSGCRTCCPCRATVRARRHAAGVDRRRSRRRRPRAAGGRRPDQRRPDRRTRGRARRRRVDADGRERAGAPASRTARCSRARSWSRARHGRWSPPPGRNAARRRSPPRRSDPPPREPAARAAEPGDPGGRRGRAGRRCRLLRHRAAAGHAV